MAERRAVGFGRRDVPPAAASSSGADGDEAPWPAGATKLDDDLAAGLLPERPKRGHKGSFGKLLVVAGSLDYAGAALLVCRAAGRAGAGLVTLAVPESLQPLFAAKVIEATTMALPEDDLEEVDPEAALARILDHEHDALVVGPGLRPGLAVSELVRELISAPGEADDAPIVLDAEALRSLATLDQWWIGDHRRGVLTPHVGEFARLRAGSGRDPEADGDLGADDDARVAAAKDAATSWGQVVVLKGARTVIAAPDGEVAIAPFENPALATGGTGDVLTGAIGSLLAQGLEPFAAARLGVYLHGAAGEAVRERIGDAGPARLGPARCARHRPSTAVDHRRAQGQRQASRDSGRGRRRPRRTRRRLPTRPRPRERGDRPQPRSSPDRGAARGGRPAATPADGLAGARSRGPDRRTWPRCGSWPGPGPPSIRSSRPTPTVTARSRSPALWRRPERTASAWRRWTRRSPCGPVGSPGRSACSIRSRPRSRRSPRRTGSASASVTGGCSRRRSRPWPRLRPDRPTSSSRWRSRPGLGRGGVAPDDVPEVLARIAAAPMVRCTACGPICRPARTLRRPRPSSRSFDAVVAAARAAGAEIPTRHLAASGGLLTEVTTLEGVRPGLLLYGLVPDELDPADLLDGRPRPIPPGPVPPCPAGPRRRSAGRSRHRLRPHVPDHPAEPDRDAAAGLWRRVQPGLVEPRRRAGSWHPGPARRQRRDGRRDGRCHRRSRRRRSRPTTNSRSSAAKATFRSRSMTWRGRAPPTGGRS